MFVACIFMKVARRRVLLASLLFGISAGIPVGPGLQAKDGLAIDPVSLAAQQSATDDKAKPDPPRPMGPLAVGKTITETLSGGEAHAYELSLKARQFVRLSVTQHHVDATQALAGPDGKVLAESDSLSGYEGSEKISWVAEVEGTYTLEVRSPDKFSSPGTYDLKIEELRASQANDQIRIHAERLWMDSLKLYQNQSFQAASNNLKELLDAWEQLADLARKADTLQMRGGIELQHGALDAALQDLKAVVDLRRQIGDRYGQADALYLTSLCHVASRQLPAAIDDLQKAEAMGAALGDELVQAWTLAQIATVQTVLGQKDNAKSSIDKSLKLYRQTEPHTRAIAPVLQLSETMSAQGIFEANQFDYIAQDYAKRINLADAYHYDQKTTPEQRRPMGALLERKAATASLLGAESHIYTLALAAKQFVRLSVTQHHIDTTQVLFGPDGGQLAESDSLSEYEGIENISWVAEAAGTYTLEVRSPDKYSSPGAYDLKIEELRASQGKDRTRVRAERLWMDSLKLYQKQTDDSLRTATNNVKELLATWKQLGERAGEADGLQLRADIEFQHGTFDAALKDFTAVADIRRQLGDRYGEIGALYFAGLSNVRLRKLQNAADNLQKALGISMELHDELEQARLASQIGGFQEMLGSKDGAKQTYEKALALYRHAPMHTRSINPLLGFTEGLLSQGNPLADQFARVALDTARKFRDRPDQGRAALLYGRTLEKLRRYQAAQERYKEASQSFFDVSDERNRATALAGIGRMCAVAGDYRCAQVWLSQAIDIHLATKDQSGEVSSSTTLAEVLNNTGQEQTALAMLNILLKSADGLHDKSLQAGVLNATGVSQTHLHQYEQARDSLNRSLTLRRELRDRDAEGNTLSDLGELYSEMGRLDQALESLKAALQAFADAQDVHGAALAQQRGAEVQRKQKDFGGAAESLLHSIDNFESERTENTTTNTGMRISFSASVAGANRKFASLLAEMENTGKFTVPPKLRNQAEDLPNLAFYYSDRSKSLELNGILGGSREGGIIRTTVESIPAKNVPLRDHEVLVEYLVGPEQTLMWIIPRKGAPAKMLRIPINEEQLSSLIKQARPNPATQVRGVTAVEPKQSQASDEAYLKVLSRLYDLLLAPVLPVLKDTPLQTSILVVPDGPLQLLPFEMLGHETKAGWRWAGSDFVFREYSSAMMLLWWRLSDLGPQGSTLGQQPKPSTEMKLLAFGDPVYNAAQTPGANRGRTRSAFERAGYSFPALPGTRIELMNVGKTFGLPANSSDLKLGPLATKSTLKRLDKSGELKHYRYLHFATHGILANDVPGVGQPALVLSLTGNSDSEGFLTMEEVEHLQLRADLVTLSACQTGLGRQITGEGTMGMARAFVVAGAPSVIVSLWSVSDESTAKLMQLFYTHLVKEHRDKGTALQMAREELRKQYPNPYYWAPFILIGEK